MRIEPLRKSLSRSGVHPVQGNQPKSTSTRGAFTGGRPLLVNEGSRPAVRFLSGPAAGPSLLIPAPANAAHGWAGVANHSSSTPRVHHHFNQFLVSPKNKNACGTTSLAMVLANRNRMAPTLAAARRLDRSVRPAGLFTAPHDIRRAARERGLGSACLNGSNFAELKARLDAGNSVIAMVRGGKTPHWVVVQSIQRDPDSGMFWVRVADPGCHQPYRMPWNAFAKKWQAPLSGFSDALNGLAGFRNYLIAFDSKPERLPPSRATHALGTQIVADGVTDVANGLKRASRADFRGLAKAYEGVVKVTMGLGVKVGRSLSKLWPF